MKKVLLNVFTLLITGMALNAQAVLVNSPGSIAGVYLFSAAGFGADLTTNVWTGDAVLADNILACQALTNAAAMNGKFAIVDRGSCEFGAKCLNAQNAGAIACVVFNNTAGAGTIVMGVGAVGGQVTIPCVMLSYEDGLKIKAEMANGTVNMTIGNIRFPNDLSTNNRAGVCHAPFGTYPAAWLRKSGDLSITPGASVTNKGNFLASNVKVNAKISYTPKGGSANEFYDKTSGDGLFVEVDSTNDVILEAQDLFGNAKGLGKGTITYSVTSDSSEQFTSNNNAISEFYLSNNLLSKARLAANAFDPFVTTSFRRSDGTNAEYLTGFKIPYGKGCKIDSILFNMAVSAPATLANLTPEATLYGWFDANGDGDASNDEISFLALGTYTYDAADLRTSAVARVPLEDFNTSDPGFVIPEDNFGIFIGVRYSGTDATPFFGFDEGIDYSCNNDLLNIAGTLAITDLPYIGITGYDANTGVPDIDNASFSFTGLTAPLAASLVLSGDCIVGTNNQLSELDAKLVIYPNPVKDHFIVDLSLNEISSKIVYNIIDNSGKLILQQADTNKGKAFRAKFNVENLLNGHYHLQVRTDKGYKQVSFEVLK
ncbi:MAG: T9SS type A sorting domain-containing protein [Saprospiraceae bacterium]|nr:T9SS type A sorting domain-containing protein [Saprospiraceae bacterium]MBK9223117.1 T9SS type A sorting domain-containing protein [Saprospiraceae bacterium]